MIREQIQSALRRRIAAECKHDAMRVFDGAGDGIPALFIDRFHSVALCHLFAGSDQESLREQLTVCAKPLLEDLQVASLYLRLHHRSAQRSAEDKAILLAGVQSDEVLISEHGIRYRIRPQSNINAGFFVDMRELRKMLRERMHGATVLNTFCFTGSLGLAAFAGGAKEIVQVDISKGALHWARENFELNRFLGNGQMRFIPEDSLAFLEREGRRSRSYTCVILDPPSYSATFVLTRDLGKLISSATSLLRAGGDLIVTANLREMGIPRIRALVEETIAPERVGEITELTPPFDYTALESEALSTRGLWISLLPPQ